MKVISALGNQIAQDSFKQHCPDLVFPIDDLNYQEGVLDSLKQMNPDAFIISLGIEGELDKYKFIQAIREINDLVKVILIIKETDKEYINWLASRGVYDVFVDNKCTFNEIYEALCREQNVIVKTEIQKEFIDRVEYRDIVKSIFREVIAVYSPLNQGSSTVAAHLAAAIASSKSYRVCLVDFNPLSPRIEEILNMKHEHTLSDALDCIIKGNLTQERLEAITEQSKYNRNLDILFGLYDINDYYVSTVEQYEEIIEKLKFRYDYVIIDTHSWFDILSTDAALEKADRVIVPVRGQKYSIDEIHRYLDMFAKYQDYDIKKFSIMINQYDADDLTSIEIAAALRYPLLGYISKHKGYDSDNCIGNLKIMNEYKVILNQMGISVQLNRRIIEAFKGIFQKQNFKRQAVSRIGNSGQDQPSG